MRLSHSREFKYHERADALSVNFCKHECNNISYVTTWSVHEKAERRNEFYNNRCMDGAAAGGVVLGPLQPS